MEEKSRLSQIYSEIEHVGDSILTDKQEIIDLDRRRTKTREGLRALTKTGESNSTICIGNTFLGVPTVYAKQHFKEDQEHTDKRINELRDNLHRNIDKLNDLENKPALKGFGLKPIEKDAMPEY